MMIYIYDPFIIAVYYGIGKPALLFRYFNQFVQEANDLLENGIIIDGVHFLVLVICFNT